VVSFAAIISRLSSVFIPKSMGIFSRLYAEESENGTLQNFRKAGLNRVAVTPGGATSAEELPHSC